MIRRQIVILLLTAATFLAIHAEASAATVWLSLNLAFNSPGDPTSGGTWTAVAKADPQGIYGVEMYIANVNFNGTFLSPPQFDIQQYSGPAANPNIRRFIFLTVTQPHPLGIGVIGSSFPSTYVDPAGLIPYGANPDYGSFTGGVALATGTFNAGLAPNWTSSSGDVSVAGVFTGPSPAPLIVADTLLTVRYVIPEPATLGLACMGLIGLIAAARRSAN